jgi:hypothetical protein
LAHDLEVLLVVNVVQEQFFVDLRHDQIKNGDDISWVELDLSIELRVELVNMVTVYIQNIVFSHLNVLQLADIVRLHTKIFTVIIYHNECVNEVLHLDLDFISVDIGSPKYLSVARCFLNIVESI